jgi:hypothetical protein
VTLFLATSAQREAARRKNPFASSSSAFLSITKILSTLSMPTTMQIRVSDRLSFTLNQRMSLRACLLPDFKNYQNEGSVLEPVTDFSWLGKHSYRKWLRLIPIRSQTRRHYAIGEKWQNEYGKIAPPVQRATINTENFSIFIDKVIYILTGREMPACTEWWVKIKFLASKFISYEFEHSIINRCHILSSGRTMRL